ncbi:MAG: succinate dehydrogenase assembly factor 2 [Pseudomonadota bacterium]
MDKETRLKKLYFRSAHRGSKETDLMLGPYASENLVKMSDAELDKFEAFIAEQDTDIWDWVNSASDNYPNKYDSLVAKLRQRYS